MFESTPRRGATPFRRLTSGAARLASDAWAQASAACRQASLSAAMFLQGERVDPETLAVTLDGERHLILRIWSELAVQSAGSAREAEQLAELETAVDLCLSRMLESLAA